MEKKNTIKQENESLNQNPINKSKELNENRFCGPTNRKA
jgi:hypothetical protein